MVSDHSNDDDASGRETHFRDPDPHGQAALLLFESLLHSLIAQSVISVEEAVRIAETAGEVKEEVADEHTESRATMLRSLALIDCIKASLEIDALET